MTPLLKKLLLPVAAFFCLLGCVLFYYTMIDPLQKEAATNRMEADQLSQQPAPPKEPSSTPVLMENTFTLQEEVPVKPLVDQFLLQLQKAEFVSGTMIETMDFAKGDGSGAAAPAAPSQEKSAAKPAAPSAPAASETSKPADSSASAKPATPSAAPPEAEPLPEGVKNIGVELEVRAEDYKGLSSFLREIEKLKRISTIESIQFTGRPEELPSAPESAPSDTEAVAGKEDGLSFKLQISAYYLPELTQYLKDLPKMKFAPHLKKKDDPLAAAHPAK